MDGSGAELTFGAHQPALLYFSAMHLPWRRRMLWYKNIKKKKKKDKSSVGW